MFSKLLNQNKCRHHCVCSSISITYVLSWVCVYNQCVFGVLFFSGCCLSIWGVNRRHQGVEIKSTNLIAITYQSFKLDDDDEPYFSLHLYTIKCHRYWWQDFYKMSHHHSSVLRLNERLFAITKILLFVHSLHKYLCPYVNWISVCNAVQKVWSS